MGVALSGGQYALWLWKEYFVEFCGRAVVFWLLAFLYGSHFQVVILMLNARAFYWCIVCFSASIDPFQILNSQIIRIILLHPVVWVGSSYKTPIVACYFPGSFRQVKLWLNQCSHAMCRLDTWSMHTLELVHTFWIFEFYTIICSHSYVSVVCGISDSFVGIGW